MELYTNCKIHRTDLFTLNKFLILEQKNKENV
jgi:hypothetical protein